MRAQPHCQSTLRAQRLATHASQMRACPTRSERRLWQAVRGRRLGAQFRRQVCVGRYIVDFLAPQPRLVVEVDGGYHQWRQRADARRDEALRRAGYRVLRLDEQVVMQQLPVALERVRIALEVESASD
jgi:very-short-patch-repair endonuclease